MGKAENTVEGYLVREIEKRGWDIDKFTTPGRKGAPDRIIFAKGMTVYAECKSPVGSLSESQKEYIRKLCRHGLPVFVTYTRDAVDDLVKWLETKTDTKPSALPFPDTKIITHIPPRQTNKRKE